jgi:sodium/hydrogen exchanger 8
VATLALFQVIDVDPTLYMLVFGESVLNDAVAIVLYRTFIRLKEFEMNGRIIMNGFLTFFNVFFGSVIIGMIIAIFSALVSRNKMIDYYLKKKSHIILM